MTVELWPDVEGGLKTYLVADADVGAVVAGRVYFAVPAEPTFPLIVIRRVGGGETPTAEAPVDNALIAFDCWGNVRDKMSAYTVKAAVRRALFKIRSRVVLRTPAAGVEGVDAFGASVDGDVWAPDPADDRSRYVVTATVTAMATAAV